MKIEELGSDEGGGGGGADSEKGIVSDDAKRVLVGAGARILFYPTLLFNVFRNKIQAEFRWWDEIDQVLILVQPSIYILIISCFSLCFVELYMGQRLCSL